LAVHGGWSKLTRDEQAGSRPGVWGNRRGCKMQASHEQRRWGGTARRGLLLLCLGAFSGCDGTCGVVDPKEMANAATITVAGVTPATWQNVTDRFTKGIVALIGGSAAMSAAVVPDPKYLFVREGPRLNDGSPSVLVVVVIKMHPTDDMLSGTQLYRQLMETARQPAFAIESAGDPALSVLWDETQAGPPADCTVTAGASAANENKEVNWNIAASIIAVCVLIFCVSVILCTTLGSCDQLCSAISPTAAPAYGAPRDLEVVPGNTDPSTLHSARPDYIRSAQNPALYDAGDISIDLGHGLSEPTTQHTYL